MIWEKDSASNILWNKESDEKDALFVDILGQKKFTIPASRGDSSPKNDRVSQNLRGKGNEYFLKNDYFAAMKLFSQSICFATNGSELLSYAYSNRSKCFFRLKMYSKCLVDIELALKSNCPQKLTHELNERHAKCLDLMDEEYSCFAPKLSFEPDDRFPCMAKVLEIQRNEQFGRQIVATADIPAGKRILVEDGFAVGVFSEGGVNCDICYSSYTNLVPCSTCTKTMFCSVKCEENDFHLVECGLRWKPQGGDDYRYSEVRSILFAIKTFADVDELMEFTTTAVASDQFDLPDSMLTDKDKYNVFFRNFSCTGPGWSDGLLLSIQIVYEGLIGHEFIAQKFSTQKQQRFLQHLIGHHFLARGKITLFNVTMQKRFNPLIGLYFNISCTPNATLLFSDNGSQVVTIRPVKSGEQVCIHYMDEDFMVKNIGYEQRRAKIQRDFNYLCMCERCVAESSNQRAPELFDDTTRNAVLEKLEEGMQNPGKRKEATEFVVDLLNKYGRNKWCVDMCTLVCLYNGFIRAEMRFEVPE